MEKTRRIAAVVLSLVMILGLAVTASAAEPDNETLINAVQAQLNAKQTVTFTNAAELSRLVQIGYSYRQPNGPISITKGTLTTKSWFVTTNKTVYVVCLSGTDMAFNQTTGIATDLLVGFEQNNLYLRNVRNAILNALLIEAFQVGELFFIHAQNKRPVSPEREIQISRELFHHRIPAHVHLRHH